MTNPETTKDPPRSKRDWIDYATFAFAILGLVLTFWGLVVLAFYTYFTAQQLGVNQRALALTDGALTETRRSNRATEKSNQIAQQSLEETRRSNSATEKSNQIAQQSLELGTRAWLVVSPKSDTTVAWPFPATIEVTNVGGTPASEVVIRYSVKFSKTIPKSIQPEMSFPGREVVGPRSQADPPKKVSYPTDNEQEVHAKRLILYLYVKIEYRDYFGKPRLTTACWEYMPDTFTWKTAALHNGME